jgi:glycosyltransferase involved in cell wall biosynthesis
MRILLVSEPGENGVFRHVEDLTEHLISTGHTVSLAYSDVRSSDRLFCLVEKVRQSGGFTENLEIANQPQFGDLRAIMRLLSLYRRFKPDVIHAHSAKAGGLVRLLRRFGAHPQVFYTPHAYYGLGRKASFSVRFFTFVERYLAPGTVTINLSPDEAEYGRNVLRLPFSLQKLIPNGVDTRHFAPGTTDERQALRAEMGIPPSAVVVGSLGRFSYQKDPMTLHRAFRACVDLMPNLYLVHVGCGSLREEVQKYAKMHGYEHRVIWIDYLRDPGPFYRMLDCFMLTSRYEGLSFAALEAMATNVPLVLSDAPGNRGFMDLGLSHLWTARVEYPASFASAITSWYDDRAHPRPCNHKEIAAAGFSRKVQFENIEAAYAQTLGPRHGKTEPSVHPVRS